VERSNIVIGKRTRLASFRCAGARFDVETDERGAGVYVRRTPCGERCGIHPPAERGWATPGDDFALALRVATLASRRVGACGWKVLDALRRAEPGVAT
jgi:hypothetical protein